MELSAPLAILLAFWGVPQDAGDEPPFPEPEARLRIPFFHHEAPVQAAVLPHGGRVLVSLDRAGTIYGWDWRTGRLLYRRPVLAPGDAAQGLTASPDGGVVALSAKSLPASTLRIHSVETGEEIRRLDSCFSPVFFRDGSVVVASDGPKIRRWSVKSGAELPGLEETKGDKKWVAISRGGTRIAATMLDSGEVVVWDGESRKRLDQRPALLEGIETTALAWAPDGRQVLVGNRWGTNVWTDPELEIFGGPPLFITPDDKRLVAGWRGKVIGIWDWKSREKIFEERLPFQSPEEIGITDDGDALLRIRGKGIHLDPLPLTKAVPVCALAATADGRAIVGQPDGAVVVWGVEKNKELGRSAFPGSVPLAFSRDGKRVLRLVAGNEWRVTDLSSGRDLFSTGDLPDGTCAALAPDGTDLAVGMVHGELVIWDIDQKKERMHLHEGIGVSRLSWSRDGKTLVWADWEGGIGVTDLLGRDRVRRSSRGSRISAVALSPEGRVILTGHMNGEVHRWSEDLGAEPSVVRTMRGPVAHLACSPDGRWIASLGDGRIFLDSLDGPQGSLELTSHRWGVEAIAFTPDGTRVLSGGSDASILVWRIPRKK
jgi:WD40 repeat protein